MLESLKDNYEIICSIGEGTFSRVIKVREKKSGQLFAAKCLMQPFLNVDEVNNYSELKTLLKLDYHENVLSLVEYVYEANEQSLMLIFDLMDKSLYDYISESARRLPESRCKLFLYQLTKGLCHLHDSGIFHRDIKPENILMKINSDLAKTNPHKAFLLQIGDLGSVSQNCYPQPRTDYVSTRWYRSPECILTNGYYGPKMDIWALGCCFYEMLKREPLFPGDDNKDMIVKIHKILGTPTKQALSHIKNQNGKNWNFQKYPSVDLYTLLPNLSTVGESLLKKMLRYNPDARINAKKIYEHSYFDSLRQKVGRSSSSSRLTSSHSNISISSQNSTKSLNSKPVSKCSSQESYKKAKELKNKLDSNYRWNLERNWNMPKCPLKKSILDNIKSANVSQSDFLK